MYIVAQRPSSCFCESAGVTTPVTPADATYLALGYRHTKPAVQWEVLSGELSQMIAKLPSFFFPRQGESVSMWESFVNNKESVFLIT